MPTTTATHRRVGPDDLDAVCDVIAECDLATVGFVDFTRDEIATDLAKATIENTGWYDGQGALVGYGWLQRIERTNQVEIDLYLRPSYDDGLGHAMLARLEERAGAARRRGRATPSPGRRRRLPAGRPHPGLAAAPRASRTQTTFTRMRIDLDPARPPELPGVRRDRPPGHRGGRPPGGARDRGGVVPRALRQRADLLRALAGPAASTAATDFRQVYLAELDGEPVGLLVSTRQFEEDEDAGYVRTLGVLPAGRGRGVGTALLRDCFARAHRDGRARGAAARRRRQRHRRAAGLRVGRDARGARDRRLGQGRAAG